MDCEKFDRIALDLLYDELDELTTAAGRRHLEQCSRCRSIDANLRATREVGVLPLADVPDGFEAKVLEAEARVRAELPLRHSFGRAISVLASYAMRPQLAMAALLLLMIGSSLLFLRTQPDEELTRERGVPELDLAAETDDREEGRASGPYKLPAMAEPAPAEEAPAAQPLAAAPRSASRGGSVESEEKVDNIEGLENLALGKKKTEAPDPNETKEDTARRELGMAQSTLNESGCNAAVPQFQRVAQRYPGSTAGNEAIWRSANCYRELGQLESARAAYRQLLATASHGTQSSEALKELGTSEPAQSSTAVASRKAKAAKKATAAEPKPAAKPSPKPSPDTVFDSKK